MSQEMLKVNGRVSPSFKSLITKSGGAEQPEVFTALYLPETVSRRSCVPPAVAFNDPSIVMEALMGEANRQVKLSGRVAGGVVASIVTVPVPEK